MKRLKAREGKGYEVQWYDETGNAADVVQMDTAEELAQYLARSCWGSIRFTQNPTVWKDGAKWCFEEYSSTDPSEPVTDTGEWEEDRYTYPGPGRANYKCTHCNELIGTWKKGLPKSQLWDYCPNCGALMIGKREVKE